MKGYMYRKKPGLGNRWEKAYCVLTYQAMYFTTMQDNTEYNHMLSLMGDAQKILSEKKGHDKNSKVYINIGMCVCVCLYEMCEYCDMCMCIDLLVCMYVLT